MAKARLGHSSPDRDSGPWQTAPHRDGSLRAGGESEAVLWHRAPAHGHPSVSPRIDDFQPKIGEVADIARDEAQAMMRGGCRQ